MLEDNKTTNNNPEDLKDFDSCEDLNMFFDNFIMTGVVVKEEEVVPGFKLKLKVLNTEELLTAESILLRANPGIPFDVIEKLRAASILSQSVLDINGVPVDKEDCTKEQNHVRRSMLYRKLLQMPAIVIQKSYELYVKAAREQTDLYTKTTETDKKIENF
jgi:hypothetical protein